MKILFLGDISGKPGRQVIKKVLPDIKTKYKPDIVIANCENAAHGIGVTRDTIKELISYGIDFFTSGDHIWSIKDFVEDLYDFSLPVLRPYNYEYQEKLPGNGFKEIDLGKKGKIIIINLIGQSFMKTNSRSPFWSSDELFKSLNIDAFGRDKSGEKQNIFVDFHAETTAEKICLGYYLKDKVSAFVGTHTHVATADQRLIGSMAFVTDVGMVGPLDASLWIKFDSAIHNFKYPFKKMPEMETKGRMIFNSVLIELENGVAKSIKRIDKILNK